MRNTISTLKAAGLVLLVACMGTVLASANANDKDSSKNSAAAKSQTVFKTAALKTSLKRETLPISSTKLNSGGKSSESLRTAAQSLFGYNGLQGGNGGGFNNGYQQQGFGGGGQFGFSPGYINGGGVGGRGNGYNQYSQLGGNAYNVLDQNQFGGQGQGQNPYYQNNYFGAAGGFNGYPYANAGGIGGGGAYPFAGQQGGFGFGGFGNQGFYPGAQFQQGQVGNRNFGFVNQGFGNPAFRNPQGGTVASSSGNFNSVPSTVQVGTGLEVGSRGFGSGGSTGGFPSASGQQYIVGNGIGQPAFIGAAGGAPGGFGFGGPSPYAGMYSGGIPGGIYRQQGLSPYDYPRSLGGPASPSTSVSSRPSSPATRLQTSGPNRYYQGVGPAGTYSPNSRERLYRFTTSNES